MSESEDSDAEFLYLCKKCPGKVEFKSREAWRAHKKAKHPKDKSRQQAQEEEEEERSIVSGSNASKQPNRRSPRATDSLPSEVEESELEAASSLSDSTMDTPQTDPEPTVAKRGRPPGPKSSKGSPRGGKRPAPAAASTPASASPSRTPPQTSTRGGKNKPGRGRGRIPDWVDSNIFNKKFPGG